MNSIANRAFLAWFMAFALLACSSQRPGYSTEDTRSAGAPLKASPTTQINSMAYTLTGPQGFMTTGSFSVRELQEAEGAIVQVPEGGPYTLNLNAASTDGYVTCTGSRSALVVGCPGDRRQDEKNVRLTCTRNRFFADAGDPYLMDSQPTFYLNAGVNLVCLASDAGPPQCTPTTCAAQQIACGPLSDGCGGMLECGTCAAPQTCGGGGQPGVCGTGASNPCDVDTTECLKAQDKPTSSPGTKCSACMAASGCLDAVGGTVGGTVDGGKQGGTCEAVAGTAPASCGAVLGTTSSVSETQVCLHTLKDIFTSACAWSQREIPCLCGTTDTTRCFSGALTPNGAAYPDYTCDFNSTDINTIQADRTVQVYGAGQATSLLQCAAAFGCDCFPTPTAPSWSTVAVAPPEGCAVQALLPDGTALCSSYANQHWYRLTPDRSGSYENGAWSLIADSALYRGGFPSTILQDGRYWVAGGESVSPGTDHAAMEIYDPALNTWTTGNPDYPGTYSDGSTGIYDGAATILSDGRVFCSTFQAGPTYSFIAYAYRPTTNTWSPTSPGPVGPTTHEQGFTLLQDGTVFALSFEAGTPGYTYDPAADLWTKRASPVLPLLFPPNGVEIGAQLLFHSGSVLVLGIPDPSLPGSLNHNNIYNPSTGSGRTTSPTARPEVDSDSRTPSAA
jgi:hypothetical protein